MLLSKEVGIYKSNVVNHVTGLIGCGLFLIFFLKHSTFSLEHLSSIGIFPLLGGVFGASFVAISNYTFSKTSVLISTLLILIGQTITSILVDYFILDTVVSSNTLIGIAFITLSILIQSSKAKEKQDIKEKSVTYL